MQATLEKVIVAKVATKDLRSALKVIAKVMNRNPVVPMLESLLIEVKEDEVIISGSDLITVVYFSVPLQQPAGAGIFTIDFVKFSKIVKYVTDEFIQLEVSGEDKLKTIELTWEDTSLKMREDFPYLDMPKFQAKEDDFGAFEISLNQLREGLKLCKKSVTSDDLRPAMTGIYFDSYGEQVNMVSTDGHRLTKYETDVQFNFPAFIVNKAVADVVEFNRMTSSEIIEISVGKTTVAFQFDNCIVVTRKMDERYPDYNAAIPTDPKVIAKVPLNLLLNRLDLARVMSNADTQQVSFNFSAGRLLLVTEDYDYDTKTRQFIPVENISSETDLKIGFNARLLKHSLAGFSGDVEVKLSASNRAALFHPKTKFAKSLTLLLMPVLLNTYE